MAAFGIRLGFDSAGRTAHARSDIVAIGRVKWIAGSKNTGKENYAWYRFDARHTSGPVFHWRGQGERDLFSSGQVAAEKRLELGDNQSK
jgi:hypothetical protein